MVEYETKMRLNFENKLQYLHSLNRSFNQAAIDKQTLLEEKELDIN